MCYNNNLSSIITQNRLTPLLRHKLKKIKLENKQQVLKEIKEKILDTEKKQALEAALENGATIWLTALPLNNGFTLDEQSFWDATHLRYTIPLECLPTTVHQLILNMLFTVNVIINHLS